MTDEPASQRTQMEAEISSLATDCDLALQDAAAVRAYLARHEVGTALEFLCDILIETDAQITEGQCRRILDAAKALGMVQRDPQEWRQRLETLLLRVV